MCCWLGDNHFCVHANGAVVHERLLAEASTCWALPVFTRLFKWKRRKFDCTYLLQSLIIICSFRLTISTSVLCFSWGFSMWTGANTLLFKNLLYKLSHKQNSSFFLWTSIKYKHHDRKRYPYFSYLQTHTDETQVKQRIRHTHLFAPFNRLSVFPFLSTSSSLLLFTHLLSFCSSSNLIFPLPPTPSFTSSVSPLNVSFSLPHLFFQINICWLACYSNNLLHPARSTDTQRQSACLDSQ